MALISCSFTLTNVIKMCLHLSIVGWNWTLCTRGCTPLVGRISSSEGAVRRLVPSQLLIVRHSLLFLCGFVICAHSTVCIYLLASWDWVLFESLSWANRILWNLKFCYRVDNSEPVVPIPSQINPFHSLQPIYLGHNLIMSSHLRLGLTSGHFTSYFSHPNFTRIFLSPIRDAGLGYHS